MNRPLLTASLIVKNEERVLDRCLESLEGVADETVVVDTGSTDATRDIATRRGARLFEFPWTGDFSAARNHALDVSNGEWILYIDADERVRRESASQLRSELLDHTHIGYEILLHPRPEHSPYRILRLFKNDLSIRFRGIIHENIWPSVIEYRARWGGNIGKSSLIVDHDGYEGDQSAKDARNYPLLLSALAEDPGRVYCWCHLAAIYAARNEKQRAEDAWEQALEIVRKNNGRARDDLLPYLGLIESGLERIGEDHLSRLRTLFEEARSRFGNRVQLQWLNGRILMREGHFRQAIAVFESVVSEGRLAAQDCLASCDFRLFTEYAYDAIAECHFRLGNYRESSYHYGLAAQCEPQRLEYRVKKALSQRLGARLTSPAS